MRFKSFGFGKVHARSGTRGGGTMAAVLGMDRDQIEKLCEEVRRGR